MDGIIKQLANPALLALTPYQPGKPISECQREYGLTRIIKLASNENPLGASPIVTQHLMSEMTEIARYPDGNAHTLKEALSHHYQLNPAQFVIGNGSEEILRMIVQAFLWGEHQMMISELAFFAYKSLAATFGIGLIEVPTLHFATDLEAMLDHLHKHPSVRMIMLANPNNPTGTYFNQTAFKAFMDKVPKDVMVTCDEAYYEYMNEKDYPQTIPLLNFYPNLIITRTFSKAYGLAGLRLGYAIASPTVIDILNRARQPFNHNYLAQVAGCLALTDQAFIKSSVRMNAIGKQQLYEGFASLQLTFIPSSANFILVKMPIAANVVFQRLLQKGIIVRPMDIYGLSEYLRFSVGTEDENRLCLHALEEILIKEKVA